MTANGTHKLPEGWCWATLGEVASERVDQSGPPGSSEFVYIDISSIDNRQKRITAPKTLQTSLTPSRARQRVDAQDVLVSMTRPNLNAIAFVPEEHHGAVASTGFHVLRTHSIVPRLIFYLVQADTFIAAMSTLVQGALYPAVRPKDIQAFSLPLPPLPEQHRIVAAIEEQFTRLDAAVASLVRARANLKRYRAAVLAAACSGRLVPTEAELARAEGREYEPAEVPADDSLVQRSSRSSVKHPNSRGGVSEGWAWATIDQLGQIQGGIQKQPKRAPVNNHYPYLRVANVLRSRLDLRDIHRIELFGNELTKLRLEKGDLLVVEGNGSATEIGRMATWNGSISDCVHQNHIIRIRMRHSVDPKYIEAWWNSPDGTRVLSKVASSTSGLYTLSVAKVASVEIPLPPLAEQHRIVAEVERRLSIVEAMEASVDASLKRAERLRQAVLRKAFAGELVPQDPGDEPASVLLERIRAERAGAGTVVKGTRQRRSHRQTTLVQE